MSTIASIKLTQQADFFESSCDQIKKQLPMYLSSQSEMITNLQLLGSMLKNIGATESNSNLKECLFDLAHREQKLSEIDVYQQCYEETLMMLDDAKTTLLQPVRDILNDYSQAMTKYDAISQSQGISKSVPDPIYEERVQQAENALPVHTELFEKFRTQHMKKLVENLLLAELQYHCKAVEELSPMLKKLRNIDL